MKNDIEIIINKMNGKADIWRNGNLFARVTIDNDHFYVYRRKQTAKKKKGKRSCILHMGMVMWVTVSKDNMLTFEHRLPGNGEPTLQEHLQLDERSIHKE